MCLVWLLSGVHAHAQAAPLDDDVARAQVLYDSLRFEAAEQAITAALARRGREPKVTAALYRLRGLIYAARDDVTRAQGDFVRWLSLDPAGRLPQGVAPKIVGPYEAALKERKGQPPLGLRPALRLTRNGEPRLRVEVLGDRGWSDQVVLLRYAVGQVGGTLAAEVPAPRSGGTAAVDLALPGLPAGSLRYFVELFSDHGNLLAQAGSFAVPLTEEPYGVTPVYRKWWFWTALAGVAVVGVGIGLGVAYR